MCVGLPAVAIYVIAGTEPPRRDASLAQLTLLCCVCWCDDADAELCRGGCRACAAGSGLYLFGKQGWLFHLGCVLCASIGVVSLHCLAPLYDICYPGKFLLLCLVPVIGWGVWCYSKKATRSQAPHSHQHEMSNLQVRVKMRSQTASRAVLPLSSDCLLCQVSSPD